MMINIKALFAPKPYFDNQGAFVPSKKASRIIDTMLIIFAAEMPLSSIYGLQLEILRAGSYVNIPDLKQFLLFLKEQGLITNRSIFTGVSYN